MSDFTFCGDWNLPPLSPVRPIRVMFLTSVRDTGTCDRNGVVVATATGEKYMEGAIERVVRATFSEGPLHGIVEVVGVVNDDLERDMVGSDYPITPNASMSWIFPHDLRTPRGQSLIVLTQHIRSDFRGLPLSDTEGRQRRKYAFERRIASHIKFLEADVLVSDHYMARLDYLITPEFGLFGRVLNIHPAVTVEGHLHCFRGKTPTADAIARAKSGVATMTGATLHCIDNQIDHGPAIAYAAPTPVYATDEPQWLRWRNYQTAKLPLIIAGLTHYATRIFPYLGMVDVNTLIARKVA